jgi:argininosuccinate synthase
MEEKDAEVIAYTGDVGQGEEEIAKARRLAKATGAADVIVDDLRRE